MRYTKAALLIFGLGLAIGFVVVVGEFSGWEYLASFVMALGLVLLPLGIVRRGHGIAALRWIARRFSRRKRGAKRGRAGRRRAAPRRRRALHPPARRAALASNSRANSRRTLNKRSPARMSGLGA